MSEKRKQASNLLLVLDKITAGKFGVPHSIPFYCDVINATSFRILDGPLLDLNREVALFIYTCCPGRYGACNRFNCNGTIAYKKD